MSEVEKCVICLNDLHNTNELLVTPCNHKFHSSCFLKWIYAHRDCPLCRNQIIKSPTEDEENYLFQLRQRIEWETIIYQNCINNKKQMDIDIKKKTKKLEEINTDIKKSIHKFNYIQYHNNKIMRSMRNRKKTLLLFK